MCTIGIRLLNIKAKGKNQMKERNIFSVLLTIIMLVAALVPMSVARAADSGTQDIVDTAAGNPQFSTLVAAVKAAGLVDTLKGKGPFTVFAPTNAAFAKLGKATIDSLLKNPDQLKSILLYHAVNGAVYSGDAAKLTNATTVNGAPVTVSVKNGQLYINNARVVTSDILTTNGVIHVIDTVIQPPQ
jgi:transforming growth factor-beta-induced protein